MTPDLAAELLAGGAQTSDLIEKFGSRNFVDAVSRGQDFEIDYAGQSAAGKYRAEGVEFHHVNVCGEILLAVFK